MKQIWFDDKYEYWEIIAIGKIIIIWERDTPWCVSILNHKQISS